MYWRAFYVPPGIESTPLPAMLISGAKYNGGLPADCWHHDLSQVATKNYPVSLGMTCGQHIESSRSFFTSQTAIMGSNQQLLKFLAILNLAPIPYTGQNSSSIGDRTSIASCSMCLKQYALKCVTVIKVSDYYMLH